jgi:hypothetical protein
MQTLAPDSFCPLTNPQPYQRERNKPRQGGVANTLNAFRPWAAGFIDLLDTALGLRAWGWGRARPRSRRLTRSRCATSHINGVNTPALIGATRIASHPPAQPEACGNDWQIDHGRDEALRVAAPSLTACNRTTATGADCAVIASANEASASGNNILKCISTVSAELQHATVKA